MIAVCFCDWGGGTLDVEKELGIEEEADGFLLRRIPGLCLEASDCLSDTEDNVIYWFSAHDEELSCAAIRRILDPLMSGRTRMQCAVKLVSGFTYGDT